MSSLRMLALSACIVLLAAGAAHAQSTAQPLLLVASPELAQAYRQTVLVAVPVSGARHVGFIINRATRLHLADMFPDHAPSAKVVDPVYLGGPQMTDAIFAVMRAGAKPVDEALPLFADLVLVAEEDAVDCVIERTPNEARYFAGFVGWDSGQLEKEIARGFWLVTDPDPALVLRKDTDGMWRELVERLSNGHAPPRRQLSASL